MVYLLIPTPFVPISLCKARKFASGGYLSKRRKEYDDEYGMMISETDTVTLVEHALFVYLIAYDFGCSSHTVMEESLLEGAEVNRRNSASIETVQTEAAMHSYTK